MDGAAQIGSAPVAGRASVGLLYWLHLGGFLTGITPVVALIMAYMARGQDGDAVADTHYTYVIRTFWIGLLYGTVSAVLLVAVVGFVLLPLTGIWWIVRCARGLSWASRGRAVPNPTTWLW